MLCYLADVEVLLNFSFCTVTVNANKTLKNKQEKNKVNASNDVFLQK